MKRRIALWLVLAFVLSMIPMTAFAELGDCPTCKGKGYTVCDTCEGSCNIDCPYCAENCEICGDGRIECPACGGQGRFDCTVCGGSGKAHVHKFKDEWTFDEDMHWYAASCGHDVRSNEGKHYDNNADGVCDVCGAKLGETSDPEVDPHKKDKCRKHGAFWKNAFKKSGLFWKNTAKKDEIRIHKPSPKKNDVNSKKYGIYIHKQSSKKNDVNSKKNKSAYSKRR